MNSKQLKILAACSMVFDHVTRIFPLGQALLPLCAALEAAGWPALGAWVLEWVPRVLLYIGRLAAPIFLFGVAQGFAHTRSVPRYLRRLLAAAVLSQAPYVLFGLAEQRVLGIAGDWRAVEGNILFTLALGLAMLSVCERLRGGGRPRWAAASALGFLALAYCLPIEGGRSLPLLLLVLFYTRGFPRWQRALLYLPAVALGRWRLVLWAWEDPAVLSTCLLNVLGLYLGLLATLLFNGRKGTRSRAFERFFYILYPAHLALLAGIGFLRAPL